MRVRIDRLNSCIAVRLSAGGGRSVTFAPGVSGLLDRRGRLRSLTIRGPVGPSVRRLLPRIAAQFHAPELSHFDPGTLLG